MSDRYEPSADDEAMQASWRALWTAGLPERLREAQPQRALKIQQATDALLSAAVAGGSVERIVAAADSLRAAWEKRDGGGDDR